MAVYVTPIMSCVRNKNWRYSKVSHLLADTIDELHLFAKKLRLKREWYQHKSSPHYDLTARKFYQARRLGAIILIGKKYLKFRDEQRTG